MIKTSIGTKLKKQELIFLSLFAILIGLLVGLLDFVFGKGLLILSAYRDTHFLYLIPFLAVSGLFIVYLYDRFGGKAKAGMSLLFEVGHGKEETIPLVLIPLVLLSTWITHLFGGSAGREGVAVQIGASLAHYFSKFSQFKSASRLYLVVGMSAGFAGLFQTPIAAVLFSLELLLLDHVFFRALIPATLAAFTASMTTHFLGLEKFSVLLKEPPVLSLDLFLKMIILGLLFGMVGNIFAVSLAHLKIYFSRILGNPYQRIMVIGFLLSLLLIFLHFGRYSGLGTNLIAAAFGEKQVLAYDWFFKLVLTVVTIAAGFQGGEVTPLFAIGASLGAALAPFFGLPIEMVAALGYVCVFASATNTFFAPLFIGFEVFGSEYFVFFFLALVFAYILNRNYSIYSKQERLIL